MNDASLRQAAQDYLLLRRCFGYRLQGHDGPLADLVTYLERVGLDTLTVESALAWAIESPATPLRHAQRLSIARGFATYLHALDPRCEVPARGLLPEGRRRVPPHIYTTEQITELITASRRLRPPLRAATLETVLGLLVVTGMRSGEAVRLNRSDVDLDAARLQIIATKFNKSRQVALHPTVTEALAGYARVRDHHLRHPAAGFFMASSGRRLSQSSLNHTFAQLVRQTGLEPPPGSRARRPRPTDFRHSFAVATMIRWYRTGEDVQALLPALSAQLGHVDPASTYWYLTGVPELLSLASERVQAARAVSL